jgi:hypothetical protein
MTAPRLRLADRGASHAAWAKKRQWRSRVYLKGKHISLGYYSSAEEARQAHAAAVKAHLGEAYLKSGTLLESRASLEDACLALPSLAAPCPAMPSLALPSLAARGLGRGSS